MGRPADIAYVIDPRFPGGTSAAVAAELPVAASLGRVEVHAVASEMFPGRTVAPRLRDALVRTGARLIWDAPRIAADLVVLHNPMFLRRAPELDTRILARRLVVVSHENFLRPGGHESFDVAHCLNVIHRAALAGQKTIAPVSDWNRTTVSDWLARHGAGSPWRIDDATWFNICDFDLEPPAAAPADRRGRHSRAGPEKFPAAEVLDLCFPNSAAANVILGADSLIRAGTTRPHWQLVPFQGMDLDRYFGMIDFMVYFTQPTIRESFGRVVAEAMAAGKVVITDPGTASTLGDGAIGAAPQDVDAIVARHVADPGLYAAQVARGQAQLARFGVEAFRGVLKTALTRARQEAAA